MLKGNLIIRVKSSATQYQPRLLVGANLVFLDVATAFPGSRRDSRNLRTAENRENLGQPEDVVENSRIKLTQL